MEIPVKKRLSAGVALVLLSPALPALLSGCGGRDCDNNRSTPQTSDDCGRGGRVGGGYFRGGGGSFGGAQNGGQSGARSGGFGGFGRSFGGSGA